VAAQAGTNGAGAGRKRAPAHVEDGEANEDGDANEDEPNGHIVINGDRSSPLSSPPAKSKRKRARAPTPEAEPEAEDAGGDGARPSREEFDLGLEDITMDIDIDAEFDLGLELPSQVPSENGTPQREAGEKKGVKRRKTVKRL